MTKPLACWIAAVSAAVAILSRKERKEHKEFFKTLRTLREPFFCGLRPRPGMVFGFVGLLCTFLNVLFVCRRMRNSAPDGRSITAFHSMVSIYPEKI